MEEQETTTEIFEDKGKGKYFTAIGRRKTSVARIRLQASGVKEIIINGKGYQEYFKDPAMAKNVIAPFEVMNLMDKFRAQAVVRGGGMSAQSEAVRHGITRALEKFNPEYRKRLKRAGFLTRDPRMRERKKFGLKRARRAPQWAKR